jgi:hypothetical protein
VEGYSRMRTNWNPLLDGEWVLYGLVVEGEHAMKRVHKDLYLSQETEISNNAHHIK